jgi:DNA-binding LacI/PurR family transcriptional regulator
MAEKEDGVMAVTMQDLADRLNISKSVVSRALSDQAGVSAETRRRVLNVAEEMGYRLNSSARALATRRTGNVAVLMRRGDLVDVNFWGRIVHGIEQALAEHHYTMMLSGLEDDVANQGVLPTALAEAKVDGSILVGLISPARIATILEVGRPVVLVDNVEPTARSSTVMADNYRAMRTATEHLLHLGHRRIGFAGDLAFAPSFADRYRGYADALRDGGIAAEEMPAATAPTDHAGLHEVNVGQLCALLSTPQAATAWICANDPIAFRLLALAGSAGMRIPDDISVVGCDDVPHASWTQPPLTTLHIPKELLGQRAVDILLRLLRNPSSPPEILLVGTRLVTRASTAAPRMSGTAP